MPRVGLAELFDVCIGLSPLDLHGSGRTGKRVSLSQVDSITFVFTKGAGTASQDPVMTLKQHTAQSGGVTSNLAVISRYFTKSSASLLGTEVWTQVDQTASAVITLTGMGSNEGLVAFNLMADSVAPGNSYVSVDFADVGANAQLGGVLYLVLTRDKGVATIMRPGLR